MSLVENTSTHVFDESWRLMLAQLLGLGRASGADFLEIFLERRRHISVLVEAGKVTSVTPSSIVGAGIRILKGESAVYVSSNDISPSGLSSILNRGLNILALSKSQNSYFKPEVSLEPLRDYGKIGNKDGWAEMLPNIQEMCDILSKANILIRNQLPHQQSVVNFHFQDWQEVMVAASDGIFARDVRLHQHVRTSCICSDGGHRTSATESYAGTSSPDFLRQFSPEVVAKSLCETTGKMLRADYVEGGQYPLVLAGGFGGVIFHEACGHLLETTQIEKNSTPFSQSKGKMIANSCLSAWDEGCTEGAFGSLDMDDEGMPSQRTHLIEDGMLKNFIADRFGNWKTGHPRTGSGRRQNHSFPAASRMRNTFIAPGPHSPQTLIESLDKGLYCKRMGGGSVGPTGDFNFSVEEAYLVENGKIVKPVKGATLIGTAKDILQKISMCANDLSLAAGFCGSVSGSIYVTVGQPHIRVDSMTVGGR